MLIVCMSDWRVVIACIAASLWPRVRRTAVASISRVLLSGIGILTKLLPRRGLSGVYWRTIALLARRLVFSRLSSRRRVFDCSTRRPVIALVSLVLQAVSSILTVHIHCRRA